MFFPVKSDKLSGLIRCYKNKGYPKIELFPSSIRDSYVPEFIFDYEKSGAHWVSVNKEGLDAQFIVRIVSGVLRITNYSIKSHNTNTCYMRAWSLEGSNDNDTYYMIDNRPESEDLTNGTIGQYPTIQPNNYYQYFRFKQTLPNKCDSSMRIFNLEFYGEFLPFKLNTCKYSKSNSEMLSIIIVILYS